LHGSSVFLCQGLNMHYSSMAELVQLEPKRDLW
jgi:hypothetical protein